MIPRRGTALSPGLTACSTLLFLLGSCVSEWIEGKIQPWHRDRLAVVCVRQSTPQQVLDHAESTRLQHGLT
jgi:hypothetical protein